MLSRLGQRVAALFRATAPDPFVLAVLLTGLTLLLAAVLTDHSLFDACAMWSGSFTGQTFGNDGIWSLLKFAMQMCLILVTGHILAASPPVACLLDRVASLPRSGAQAAAMVALVAALLAVLNWGLGLIAGALLARKVGQAMERKGVAAHYPLLCAAGYVGLMVWHGGFSGSAPLTVARAEDLERFLRGSAVLAEPIPLSRTILSLENLVITGGLIALSAIVMALLAPKRAEDCTPFSCSSPVGRVEQSPRRPARPSPLSGSPDSVDEGDSPGLLPRFLENTPIINLALALLIGAWAWPFYRSAGITNLGLDSVNLTMLMLGLVLHATPKRFLAAAEEAVRGCAGIIIQFPLYAGIMGVMSASGLTALLAERIASVSTPTTLPLFTFASAGVVNLFVPSGGGQWAVQGPIALQAAQEAGVDPAKMVLAVAYGDQLTNMLQPFWALPLLAITGAKARDIVGYTAILMVLAAVWIGVWLVVF